jgi:FHA domain
MDEPTPIVPIVSKDYMTRWGTANLRPNTSVTIHVGSTKAEPIRACLTRPLVLGRFVATDPNIDINLEAYAAAEKGVSRQHASLTLVAKTVMLTDLNSLNGTFLNGHRLAPNKHYIVRDGDEIRLSELAIYIFYTTQPSEENLTFK